MVSTEQLQSIADLAARYRNDANLHARLREQHPELHFTLCTDDDVCGPEPIHGNEQFNLYLIDSASHCLSLTRDLASATGVVVAEIACDD